MLRLTASFASRVLRAEAASSAGLVAAAGKQVTVPSAPMGVSVDVIVPKESETSLFKTPLGHISGQPPNQAERHVHIYQPTKNAMQSGTYQTRYWKIAFDTEGRWENPTMGWASSADPLQAIDLTLRFKSKEAAVAFATNNGWNYTVTEPQRRNVAIKRMYADNFKHIPGTIRFIKTK